MNLPIIAIIGRPNVGKSTFFNRIIKKRDAIVDDTPGVTRDRHYAVTDWGGKSFVLVDTGGYLPDARNEMDLAIREQVDIAIEEADILLFMVDLTTGITLTDEAIAERLHRTDKPVLLIVNKVDNESRESEAYQFLNLGLGDPHMISAVQGRGIGDFLDVLTAHITEQIREAREAEDAIKLAIVGKENVGKSSFVNTLLGKDRVIVTPIPGTTRDPIDTPLKFKKRNYLLIDTAGLKRRTKVKENIVFYSQLRTMRSIQRADVVLYFIDVTQGLTRQDLRVVSETLEARKPIVVVFNKWDLIEKDSHTLHQWEKEISERFGAYQYVPLIFTSVLEKKRLYKLLDLATEVYEEYRKHIPTSELNRVLLPIIKENSPPAVKGKEVKINYITQLKTAPPVFAFFGNHPDLIPQNYRRFLERQIREHWEFKGTPISLVFKSKH
ncbi:MAG: ribosome biogenesis GTPase Der [Calditrichaeota bacterium]|nr:MAG: ribosome biogenesis GTPase Der [Calditrichota bacterium]